MHLLDINIINNGDVILKIYWLFFGVYEGKIENSTLHIHDNVVPK